MPKLLKTPFAADAAEGYRTDVQESNGAALNSATYQIGFPPITMQSIASNGMPPKGSDLNGVLYDVTDNLVFLTQGGGYGFDSAYATAIGGYPLNARLRLNNGTEAISTIANNTNDPNVDMTGWVEIGKSSFVDLVKKYGKLNLKNNFTSIINSEFSSISASGGGAVILDDGLWTVNASEGITLKDNIEFIMGINTQLVLDSYNTGNYEILRIHDVKNVKISGGLINGSRAKRNSSTGVAYKEWKPNTSYAVGDCIALQRMGAQVTVAGTTGTIPPTITKDPSGFVTIGVNYTDGTCQYTSIQDVGEWGMGISIRGSSNVSISNSIIINCWGDAVYIGRTPGLFCSEDIYLNNIYALNNRRQGISVISLRDSVWNNISLVGTNGADPQAGVDFEPNSSDEILENITINGLYTSGNYGAGIHAYFGPFNELTSPVNKVSIIINGFKDEGSKHNIYMRTVSNPNVKGTVTINGARLYNPTSASLNANVFLEACEAYGTQLILNKPYFESDKPAPFVRIGYDSNNDSVGGIHITEMDSNYTATKYDNPILLTSSTVPPVNISLIDPIKIDSINTYTSIGASNYNVSDVKIVDRYGACKLKFNASISHQNWWMYSDIIFDEPAAGWATYSIVSIKKGRKHRILNNTTSQQLTIAINAAVTVVDYPPSASGSVLNFFVLPNEWIEIESIAENVIRIVSKSSGVTDTSSVLTYSYAGASIPANSTTSVSVPFNGAKNTNFFNAYFGNATDLIIRAVCNTNGTVVLKITNPTTSAITAPTGNIFIKKL